MAFGGLSNPRFCVLLSPALTNSLFKYEDDQGLVASGNQPMRYGFKAHDLQLSEDLFRRQA